ncbi:hypothetical protein X726_28730 [Mesorhizobium sp. L103C105A0]|nr:hypothetical protein X726_28730 [Mesorhizobium sp. L103C105A0]
MMRIFGASPRLGKDEPEAEPMHYLSLEGTPVIA